MADSNFYLGRKYDPTKQAVTDEQVTYDPGDLTTHAVVTGMTGSGKTGLCVVLLEEAALKGIPAIIIDPKGDLTNLLLHFPDLAPQDFQPWIDSELARRAGKTLEQLAEDAAASWRDGLKEWGIPQERLSDSEKLRSVCGLHPGLRFWHPCQRIIFACRARFNLEG